MAKSTPVIPLIAFLDKLVLRTNQLMEPALTAKAKLIRIGVKRPSDEQMDMLEANIDMEFEDGGKVFFLSVQRAGSTYQTVNAQGMPMLGTRRQNTATFVESSGCNVGDISAKIAALSTA